MWWPDGGARGRRSQGITNQQQLILIDMNVWTKCRDKASTKKHKCPKHFVARTQYRTETDRHWHLKRPAASVAKNVPLHTQSSNLHNHTVCTVNLQGHTSLLAWQLNYELRAWHVRGIWSNMAPSSWMFFFHILQRWINMLREVPGELRKKTWNLIHCVDNDDTLSHVESQTFEMKTPHWGISL